MRVVVIAGKGDQPGGLLPPSDRAAISLALQCFGQAAVEVLSPAGDREVLAYALAAGVPRVACADDLTSLDFDLALVGRGGAGAWGDRLAAALAESRRCALVLEVLQLRAEDGAVLATRDLGQGSREVLAIDGAAVLGVSERARCSRYVSHYRRQRATQSLPDSDPASWSDDPLSEVAGPWVEARPRPRIAGPNRRRAAGATARMMATMGLEPEPASTGAGALEADPATCARHLLRFLRHHGILGPRSASSERPLPRKMSEPAGGSEPPPVSGRGPVPLTGVRQAASRRPVALRAEEDARRSATFPAGRRARRPRPLGEQINRRRIPVQLEARQKTDE